MTTYSSTHFGEIESTLSATLPDNLVHRDVIGNTLASGHEFSAKRRHTVKLVDLPSKVISVTIGGLLPGQSSRRHRHNYETVIYVLEGTGRSTIEGKEVLWSKGDAFYIPVWAWHQHRNSSDTEEVLYIACENAPHLQNLGIALREEG